MAEKDIYDLIVIGASKEGLELLSYVNSQVDQKLALVDYDFGDKLDSCFDADHIDLIQKRVKFISFVHGIIILTMEDSSYLATRNLVVATGIVSKHDNLDIDEYTDTEFEFKSKVKGCAAVVGNTYPAADTANELAKDFEQVYLIIDDVDEHFVTKLANNVTIIYNAKIAEKIYRSTPKTNKKYLGSIVLDNYSKIPCRVIVYRDDIKPEIPEAGPSIFTYNIKGEIETNENHSVKNIPFVYAIGNCSDRYSDDLDKLADHLIAVNKWREI